MASWSVLSRDGAGASPVEAADATVFVREKFSWFAFLLTPIALIRYRLWLALFAFALAGVVLEASVEFLDLPSEAMSIALAGLSFLIALELPTLRVRKLLKRGYREEGIVVADTLEAAEQRYFSDLAARPAPTPRPAPPPAPPAPPGAQVPSHGIIGAFAGGLRS